MSYMNTDKYEKLTPEIAAKYDQHWTEVLKLAEKYGFIRQAFGGVAILATHQNIDKEAHRIQVNQAGNI